MPEPTAIREIYPEVSMSDVGTLKAELKKLSVRAIRMKMNLHDLSEEMPVNWPSPWMAQETYDAFKALDEARRAIKALEDAAVA